MCARVARLVSVVIRFDGRARASRVSCRFLIRFDDSEHNVSTVVETGGIVDLGTGIGSGSGHDLRKGGEEREEREEEHVAQTSSSSPTERLSERRTPSQERRLA